MGTRGCWPAQHTDPSEAVATGTGRHRPRITGLWDQDAFAEYIRIHGSDSFVLLPHGQLQSFVRAGHSHWVPGAFAAHFTGLSEELPERGMTLLHGFLSALPSK
ncbi:unnamed protein product [Symbiodinium pilosum]|uniref:Uncharacterized protein n=1 Tax=Symbiodinium pilosum TaxID=2952 RepID=A0A812YJ63_SYMPI|nr:unnamed protein product [Symbiodinium pilosum]